MNRKVYLNPTCSLYSVPKYNTKIILLLTNTTTEQNDMYGFVCQHFYTASVKAIIVYAVFFFTVDNLCKLAGCEHTCKVVDQQAVCGCQVGFELNADMKNCHGRLTIQ